MKRLLLIASLACSTVLAQQPPEEERGARPGLAYRVDGLDQVNLFNGTITMNMAIGQSYPVNGTLSYSLMASYATNAWTQVRYEVDDDEGRTWTKYKYPNKHQNAGLGWIVTLGRLIRPDDGSSSDIQSYLAPDGGTHEFSLTLHPGEAIVPNVRYTRDGTYLRLRTMTNGTYRLDFPNGHVHEFRSDGQLSKITDPFGNYVQIAYRTRSYLGAPNEPFPQSTLWEITDSVGRTHYVYFRPGWEYVEERYFDPPVPHEIVDKVELAAFNSQRATYTFQYDALPETLPPGEPPIALRTSRRCSLRQNQEVGPYLLVPILRTLEMPHGITYDMVTDRGDQISCGTDSGNLTRLTIPTGGIIDWTYQQYEFGAGVYNRGIATKTVKQANGTVIGSTEYALDTASRTDGVTDKVRTVFNKDAGGTVLNATKHYFSGCSHSSCDNPAAYGLPYTITQTSGGANLSTEIQEPNGSGGLVTRRRTYVRYEADYPLDDLTTTDKSNQRPAFERSEYVGDGRSADVSYSNFDGLGHYRETRTDGNFQSGNVRASFTNYNPLRGRYEPDGSGTFTMPLTTGSWLLTTYDRQWTMEPVNGVDTYSASTSCFDSLGFRTSHRAFTNSTPDGSASPTAAARDLLTIFTRNAAGNLTGEQSFGGAATTDYSGAVPAPSHSCGQPHANPQYELAHTYEHGVLATSTYVGSGINFYVTDRQIDQNTGLVKTTRSFRSHGGSDGLTTTHTYDLLGRPLSDAGPKLTRSYQYTVQPPTISVTESKTSNGTILGSGTTTYNALGWPTSTIAFGATLPTVTRYDGLGRPIAIIPPGVSESDATTISYTGVSTVSRTTKIRTGGDANTTTLSSATTTEEYDRQGRLVRVIESNGTRTRYGYDAGGRLSSVCANENPTTFACGQTRSFTYDNRGLLTSETHPERSSTSYTAYDARGHVRRRYVGSPYTSDLSFTYDAAERLTAVDEKVSSTVTRPLKRFTFGTSNLGSDLRNGRLTEAVRYNWLPINFTVQVFENYTYAGPQGEVSERVTTDYDCNNTLEDCTPLRTGLLAHRFAQNFTYDERGAVLTETHPNCEDYTSGSTVNCTGNTFTTTNTYTKGWLTGVSWPGSIAAGITYAPSGLPSSITHPNGVTDVQTPDPDIPARPLSIVTSGATYQGTCVVPAFTTQPVSQTVLNNTSVTLTAAAVGETGMSITYAWYEGVAPDKSIPRGTGASLTRTITATTNFWVEATNACENGAVASTTATITACDAADAVASPDVTITRGQSTTLEPTIGGSAPLTYQWYTVASNGTETPIGGATSPTLTVEPVTTTRYRLRVTNDCADDIATTCVTVVDPPSAPATVQATYNGSAVVVSWSAGSSSVGVDGYRLERSDGRVVTLINVTTYNDNYSLASGAAYSYRVRTRDDNGVYSDPSGVDIATILVFADDPRPPSLAIRGIHIGELRRAVDAVRAVAGLPPAWTSYAAATGLVRATDFMTLRDELNEARALLGLPEIVLSDTVAVDQVIRARTLDELRNGVR